MWLLHKEKIFQIKILESDYKFYIHHCYFEMKNPLKDSGLTKVLNLQLNLELPVKIG